MSGVSPDSNDPSSPSAAPAGPRRRAVVTGASAGIGEAFAERLAADRTDLVLVARRLDRLEQLAERLERQRRVAVEVLAADLTDPEDLASLAGRLAERPPDLLVNNAGFGSSGPFARLPVDGELGQIQLNVLALVRLTHAVVPGMVERGRGDVINVSSLASLSPLPFSTTYGATKAFVTSFTEGLAEELRGSGVRMQALLPGFTRTEFQEVAGVDTGGVPEMAWMSAEAVVEASLAALARGDVRCIPGGANRVVAVVQGSTPSALTRRLLGAFMRRTMDE